MTCTVLVFTGDYLLFTSHFLHSHLYILLSQYENRAPVSTATDDYNY